MSHENGDISFWYQESKTKSWKTRTESAVKFLWLALQHVLPKGFRRARDYGFLHCLAIRTLQRIQLLLKVAIGPAAEVLKNLHLCPTCHKPMSILLFSR
ncbi:MAG: hypothetical protein GY820_19485 [Gammaproteobacteria bacterium]|nr:hypothetical protein [Gammaproteobacteria bacterium]